MSCPRASGTASGYLRADAARAACPHTGIGRVASAGVTAIGVHVDPIDPIAAGTARGADAVQFFLADPQGWQAPEPRQDAATLAASTLRIVIHSPYVVNVATTNNRIRIPSRKLVAAHAAAAATVGALGLVVHGGHVSAGDDPQAGIDNWRKLFERQAAAGGFAVPILIENTAGGDGAMTRGLDRIARLWDAVGEFGPGFCLDTCHAFAAGEELAGIVERVRAITGRVDVVHANDSRDESGSSRDRHANIGHGHIGVEPIAAAVAAAVGAVAICETPGGIAEHTRDIQALRDATG